MAFKKLEEQVNCSVCLETFSKPKLLLCNHVYCETCLERLVAPDIHNLTCPTCRKITPIPDAGITGLPAAFYINQLLEILKEQKQEEKPLQPLQEVAISLPSPVSSQKSIAGGCSEHLGREIDLYCETCNLLICCKCAIKGGKHHEHRYEELNEAFEKHKKEILALLGPLDDQLVSVDKALIQMDECRDELLDLQAAAENNISSTISQLQESLSQRKTELVDRLHSIVQTKLKHLAAQRNQIETTQTHLRNFLSFTKQQLEIGSKEDVVMKQTDSVQKAKDLSANFQPEMLKPNTSADIIFLASADITRGCQEYGTIVALSSPDPSKSYVTGDCVKATPTVVGETSTALLHTFNINDQRCEKKEAANFLVCEVVSKLTESSKIASLENKGNGEYEITYQPTTKGKNQLHVKVEDQHVNGSPFPIPVTSAVEDIGNLVHTISYVKEPVGIAIGHGGQVIVTEWSCHCVSVYKPNGKKLFYFGSHGSSPGQFESPNGVAVDPEGNIYVADTWNHRVQKFTSNGFFVTEAGCRGTGPLQLYHPRGIAASGNRIYVGDLNCSIKVLNSDLTFCSTFGKKGSSKGQFDGIGHIACESSTGNVYVSDSHNNRIQVFTAEGKFVRMFGKQGKEKGKIDCPFGMAVDSNGMVYVSEIANNRVSVFNPRGQFVTSFGSRGEGPGEFVSPNGITVDSCGVVYVCDSENDRVQLF